MNAKLFPAIKASMRAVLAPSDILSCAPPRPKSNHRIRAARRVPAIMDARRDALNNRPEPRLTLRRLRMAHDAADDAAAFIAHVEIVVRPMIAAAALAPEDEGEGGHGLDYSAIVVARLIVLWTTLHFRFKLGPKLGPKCFPM